MATDSTERLLLAVDGEPHTHAAIAQAARLSGALALPVTVLHVEDPYLKKFSNDIYAQGREEYRAHVDRCMAEQGVRALEEAEARLRDAGCRCEVRVRKGEPVAEIRAELEAGPYSLLVLGRRPSRRRWRTPRAGDVPSQLVNAGLRTPIWVVPGEKTG